MDVRIACIAVWEPIKRGFIFLQQNKYGTFLKQIVIFPDTSLTASLLVAFSQLNKVSCLVSTCISSDNSFSSVRQEPPFEPWKGSFFLPQ